MVRFNRLVCALAVVVCVGIAYGAAVKVRSLTPMGSGVTENPNGDGMAIVNFHAGSSSGGSNEIQVAITDFLADTTYGVKVIGGDGAECTDPDAITTNANGNGSAHVDCGFGTSLATAPVTVIVFILDPDDREVGCPFPPCDPDISNISATEIRAQGTGN